MESETIDPSRRILETMRRALLFLLGMACSSNALLGDWKIWTPVQTSRMAVPRNAGGNIKSIFAATTGGVVEWDPVLSKGTVHTGLQNLPCLDVASVVADSSGRIWAICTDGNLAILDVGVSSWTSSLTWRVGSYTTSGWTFNPGAATFWKGYLLLGGPKGLSIFSTNDTVAVDNITAFGSIRDTVTSVMAQNDTLWISLPEGLAYATDPVWNTDSASKHIGKAGYYLSADRWTVLPALSRGAYTLLRDSTGVHLGSLGQWSDFANGLQINGGKFSWKSGSAFVPGAAQALSTPWGYFMSTSGNGFQLLTSDGFLHPLHPDGALPDQLPHSVAITADGTLFHVVAGSSPRLWIQKPGGIWAADTIKVRLPDSTGKLVLTTPFWDDNETVSRHRHQFTIGPKGERVAISFGGGPWQGVQGNGVFVSTSTGNWSSWSNSQDTCLAYLPQNVPASFGVATISARSDSSGTWISDIGQANASPRIEFLPAGGTSHPTCLELHEADLGLQDGLAVSDFVTAGDALWLATNIGLVRVPNPSPAYPPSIAQGISSWPDPSSAPLLWRVTKMSLGGSTWIIGAGTGALGAHSLGGTKTDTFFITTGIDQTYSTLAVDALGQLWAAGDQGIDIYSVSLDVNNHPSFQKIKRVTRSDGLPDNAVIDLQLDLASGKALIATGGALSLWTSPFRMAPVKLAKSTIKVWPNPVRLRQNRILSVDGATSNANFDLVAADGTLVLHQDHSKSSYGLFKIDLPSPSKLRPGVYYWSLKDSQNSAHGALLVGE
jgi:hypothetical protein